MDDTNTARASILPSGHRIFERWQIEALVARDEKNQCYLAKNISSGEHVTLRVPSAARCSRPSQIEAFQRVTAILKNLKHPSLPRFYEFDQAEDIWYFVTEHLEGVALESLLRSSPPRMERAVAIARALLSGLHALHTAGLVHGDLRTAGVLVKTPNETQGAQPAARLLDVFFAKPPDAEHTMARDVDCASAILYEMIVGVPPEEGERAPAQNKRNGNAIPPALTSVLSRALSPDRAERYQTAADLEQALVSAMQQPLVILPSNAGHGDIDAETLATSDTELNLKDEARAAVAQSSPASVETAKTLPVATEGSPSPIALQAALDARDARKDTLPSAATPAPKRALQKSGLERWFWLLALLVAVACVALGVWIGAK